MCTSGGSGNNGGGGSDPGDLPNRNIRFDPPAPLPPPPAVSAVGSSEKAKSAVRTGLAQAGARKRNPFASQNTLVTGTLGSGASPNAASKTLLGQ